MTADATVRRYYDALDAGEYDVLESILAPGFVQRRPDRTFEERDAFVRFMREDRPQSDTRHEVDEIVADDRRVAVRGRLLEDDGTHLLEFADVFELVDGRIVRLETYTR
ncbi:nuclear transport factor 2 family protein [Natrialbaceae archaeon AArc-T1-2]|uniref:nuclear transport factor 2 family protein n=1 Tax=Natrialbaceae archaeon AArc-T1-2 TaxID=3053904 RepID=UPI00255A884F|nr:nuclear transport factor 2 family protein [Natrialbaceae archaeon AArc-T1-2]WIV67806.1 nuclear transport factor 2 family protein [Natrialbaceae archaeon AArc-T1-2]